MRELEYPKSPNASNNTINPFESYNGVLNIAPIKISGQYKIVVALDGNLYLDDYNNHRVSIDMDKKFLPQVANFLQISTNIVEKNVISYGGFQRLTKKFWHIPLYINQDILDKKLPNYFLLTRTINEELFEEDLQRYGNTVLLADLNKNGINSIINQINDECNEYPLYFNFQDSTYTVYGYSLNEECWKSVTVNTIYSQANQTYIDVFNNSIMNTFVNNNLIYPKFINIEFEFEYVDNKTPFNNFYGYLSYGKQITEMNTNRCIEIKIQEYDDYIIWRQLLFGEELVLNKYIRPIKTISTIPITVQPSQIRFKVNTINVEDYFCINNPDGSVFYQYNIQLKDIHPSSLYTTLVNVCKLMTKDNGLSFKFTVNTNCIVTCKSSIGDIYEEQYSMIVPNTCNILDRYMNEDNVKDANYYYFRGITSYDVQLSNISNVTKEGNLLSVNEKYFKIVDAFKFNDSPIIRCVGVEDITDYPEIDSYTQVEFFSIKTEKLYAMPEIPFYSVNGNLKASYQFNNKKYIDYIAKLGAIKYPGLPDETPEDKLRSQDFINALIDYSEKTRTNTDSLPYIAEDLVLLEPVEYAIVIQDETNNEININTMMFNSVGSTSMITPNILNLDKHLYVNNGNTDLNLDDTDQLSFHWFLIRANNCWEILEEEKDTLTNEEYEDGKLVSLRYFRVGEKPKITSRIIRVNDDFCETIFLGIKYRFPLKYESFQFAVYLDIDNQLDTDINYKFIVDDINSELYLRIGYYMDFCDFIRLADETHPAIMDLAFLYNVRNSYNKQSTFLSGFVSGGVELCNDEILVMFEGKQTTDWKKISSSDKKYYVCLKNSPLTEPVDFRNLFKEDSEQTTETISQYQDFYMYSTINYRGINYTYVSLVIKALHIKEVGENYVWCEDIKLRFFDTREMFIQKYVPGSKPAIEEWFNTPITPDRIIRTEDKTTNLFGDYVKIATVRVERTIEESTILVPEVFELLLPAKELSLKENYFEITKTIRESDKGNGTKETFFDSFKFKEFLKPDWDVYDLIEQFEIDSFDEYTEISKITLFDRNQLWYFIKDYMRYDVRFKYVSEEQIRLGVNNLLSSNLKDYCKLRSLPILKLNDVEDLENKNMFGFIKLDVVENDYNSVIWNIITSNGYENKIFNINRYKAPYLPYLRKHGFNRDKSIGFKNGVVDFQKLIYRKNNRLHNIYDPDFAGDKISATGLWDEVSGNVVSSLFCREEDIKITIPFAVDINIYQLFISQINLDEALINNSYNEDYISKIDENIEEYIMKSYGDYLLKNFYVFSNVKNDAGKILKYFEDSLNKQIIHLQITTQNNPLYLNITFTRKK